MDLQTARLSFKVLLIVQVFLLFFVAAITFTSTENSSKSTSLYDLVKPVDKAKVLQLFIGPLNLVGLIFSAVTSASQLSLLLLYMPVRWTLAAYLLAACTAARPLLYGGGLLLELLIEASLAAFIWRLWQQQQQQNRSGTNTQTQDQQKNLSQVSITVFDGALSPLPSYLEAVTREVPKKNPNSKH